MESTEISTFKQVLERYDGVLGFSKTNIHFEEREFDRKLANGHAELVFGKKCRIIQIGIAAAHGGFELKVQLTAALEAPGYAVVDKMPDRQIAAEGSKVLCEIERG